MTRPSMTYIHVHTTYWYTIYSAKEMTKAMNLRLQQKTAELDSSHSELTQARKASEAEALRTQAALKETAAGKSVNVIL